jgi:hypothetical protein
MNTELERAWAAGFFDGEGYVGSYNLEGRGRSISCSITQSSYTDKEPSSLIRFQKIVGMGKIYPKSTPLPYKPRYSWSVQTIQSVQTVYEILLPYLDDVKKNQFERAISTYKETPSFTELELCKKRLHKKVKGYRQCKECQDLWQQERNEMRKLERRVARKLVV